MMIFNKDDFDDHDDLALTHVNEIENLNNHPHIDIKYSTYEYDLY